MIPQYSEGMPSVEIDEEREAFWVVGDEEELQRFYAIYSDDLALPISERYARGLYAFLQATNGRHFPYVKGHVTGPLTFTLGVKDNRGRPIYFNEELREVALFVLQAKTRWQIELLRRIAERVIIFVDEPVLSALGTSAYLGVAPAEAFRLLQATVGTIRDAGALAGLHCCGKADWPLVIESQASIISFDAYDYLETLALYPDEFTRFLEKKGWLAWGIVPTTDAIAHEDTFSLRERFERGIRFLSTSLPRDLLLSQVILTPSCGTGSRTIGETEMIFRTLAELSAALKAGAR